MGYLFHDDDDDDDTASCGKKICLQSINSMVLKCCLRDGATDGKILCRVRHDEDISRYHWPRDHGGAGELDSRTVASLRALGPWAPPAERGPSLESITGFSLQLIFAKVKAEN